MISKEKLLENRQEDDAGRYLRKYKRHMSLLEKSPLARVRPHGITAIDTVNLGRQLDQWGAYHKMCEDDGSVTQLGTYPNVALDALTVNFGQSPINVIASVQPIDEVRGLVYFRDFVAQNTRGNVEAGQNIMSTLAIPDVFPVGYASDTTFNTTFLSETASTTYYTGVSLLGDEDFSSPLNPQTLNISGTVVTESGTATFSNVQPNVTTGAFSQVSQEGSSSGYLSMRGVVDFSNGTTSVYFSSTDSSTIVSVSLQATVQTVEEDNTDLQKAILVLQTKPILARFFALKSTIGLAESYMLRKRFGISAEEEIAKDLTVAINLEIMNTAVGILLANVPTTAPTQVTWPREAPPGVSLFEHLMTLPMAMADADAQIVARAGRGTVNCWLVGRESGAIVSQLPGFTKLSDDNSFGPHIFGTYNGVTIVRVPYNSVLPDNTMLGIFKGPGAFEAPLVYAPYMPLVVTNTLPMAYNPLQQQRAAAVWAGLDPLISNLSTQLLISESGFDYGNTGQQNS